MESALRQAKKAMEGRKEAQMLYRAMQGVYGQLQDGKLDEYYKLGSQQEQIELIVQQKCVLEMMENIDTILEPKGKSGKEANELRQQGNRDFVKKFYLNALSQYNKAIMHAPLPGKDASQEYPNELALAFGNRAAVLFHLKKYELCVRDVDSALENGYPEDLKYKLFDRKGKCLIELQKKAEAIEQLELAIKSLENTKLDEKEKKHWKDMLDKQVANFQKREINKNKTMPQTSFKLKAPPVDDKGNDTFFNASRVVDITATPSKGRYAVATEKIRVGNVVVSEAPYAAVLFSEFFPKICYSCFSQMNVPLPCPTCSVVGFCSKECRDSSMPVHKFECPFMNLLEEPWNGRHGHLALRMAILTGIETMLNSPPLTKPTKSPMEEAESIPFTNNYESCMRLLTHHTERSRGLQFECGFQAVFLTRILDCTGFFGTRERQNLPKDITAKTKEMKIPDENPPKEITAKTEEMKIPDENPPKEITAKTKEMKNADENPPKEITAKTEEMKIPDEDKPKFELNLPKDFSSVASMIYIYLEIIQVNAQKVYTLQDPNSFQKADQINMGLGLYPTVGLFNHSCIPSATVEFFGNQCVVRSMSNIKPGQPIDVDYGTFFHLEVREERRKYLRKDYFFECNCKACSEWWPDWREMPDEPMFICVECSEMLDMENIVDHTFAKCLKCNVKRNVGEALSNLGQTHEMYAKAMDDASNGNHDLAITNFEWHFSVMEKHLMHPWRDLVACQAALRQCYKMRGNKCMNFL